MSFGLKNTGATYQRCMQSYFERQIGRNLKVYVDNIVVKTQWSSSLITDLEETCANLRRFSINLNLEKCTFRHNQGKLLGYIINKGSIEVNPDMISTIIEIDQVRNVKDVQWLMGSLTTLSRFVSWLEERGLPLYMLLKKV
jgi:hypothetical protein